MIREDILKQLQEQFEVIKEMSGVDPDMEYAKELEDLLESDFEDLTKEMSDRFNRKTIYVQKTSESVEDLKYAYETDSGFDLKSTIECVIPPFGRCLIPTGVKVSFDIGYELQIRPKSGLALNKGLTVLNTPGTIDQGYTDEIGVIVFNTNSTPIEISKGMKVGQAVLCPVVNGKFVKFEYVGSIEHKDRGNNGYGSTGY